MTRRRLPTSEVDLAWLRDMLWPGSEHVVARIGRGAPEGFGARETYLVLPNTRHPTFVIPLSSHRVAASTVESYNAMRPAKVRMARSGLSMSLRLGVAQQVFRDRLVVSMAPETSADEAAEGSLPAHLARVLGVTELAIAARVPRRVGRKPVVYVFRPSGEPLAFVKVGWDPLTTDLVHAEAAALQLIGRRRPQQIRAPELVHEGGWRDRRLSVSSPLPPDTRRYGDARKLPPVASMLAIAELGERQERALVDSSYWQTTLGRLTRLQEETDNPELEAIWDSVRTFARRSGRDRLPFGFWHGDWVPWNLGWHGGRLFAWDWENASDGVPLGYDVLHFLFSVAFTLDRLEVREATRRSRDGAPVLRSLGVSERAVPTVASLYLLELLLRYLDASRLGAGSNPWLLPGLYAAVKESLGQN